MYVSTGGRSVFLTNVEVGDLVTYASTPAAGEPGHTLVIADGLLGRLRDEAEANAAPAADVTPADPEAG